jgi:hypothetical protein
MNIGKHNLFSTVKGILNIQSILQIFKMIRIRK